MGGRQNTCAELADRNNSNMRKALHLPAANKRNGFTLIELMIALVVVALLSAVAFPSFMDTIRKSRRSEAFTALNCAQQAQERWRAGNASYTSNLTNAWPAGLGCLATTPNGYYSISIADVSETGYSVTATAVSGTSQANDTGCIRLRVRVAGGNVSYGSGGSGGPVDESSASQCWSR